MRLPVENNNDCRPKISWSDFVWDDIDEDSEPGITLPSWSSVKGKDPLPSSSVQRRVNRVKNVSSGKWFSQKTVSDVWRTPATSSSDSSARSGLSSQDQMLEFPSLEVYRKSSPVASEPKKNERKNKIQNVELVEQEASIETPVPADPAPQSEEPTIKDPQNLVNNTDNPEYPDVSSTRSAVSKKKKKKINTRKREEMYLLAASLHQEQQMRTEVETDSNIEHMCKLEDRQQLTPEPPVTPPPAPQLEHSASDVSITSPGASEGKTKKNNRIPSAENVELVEQEVSTEPPVPADPGPPYEEPTIEDPQNVEKNMYNPEDPDVSSTRSAVSTKKKKCLSASDKMYLLIASLHQEQEMRTEVETDSNIEHMCKLEDRQQLTPEPPVTPPPAPQLENSASDVSITSPGASEGKTKKNTRIPSAENVELVEQKVSTEPPVPADPGPPYEEPTIEDPQNVEKNMYNPEDPDVSSTRCAVSTKKKKCLSASDKMYLLHGSLLQEQQMRTKVETDSNIEHMCKLEDRQQLTPEPPVTPPPAPQLEHSASDVSITSPGASERKTKKEIRIQPPVPADPARPSEEPKIEDPQKKPKDPALPDRSSLTPRASKSSKKNKRRRRNKIRFPPMQEISSTLQTDSCNKDQVMLLDLSKDPGVTPTQVPLPDPGISKLPKDPASPDRSSTPPGAPKSSKRKSRRGKNKICFPPMQEISSTLETDSCSKDQVMLLDLTEDPAVTPTPAPLPDPGISKVPKDPASDPPAASDEKKNRICFPPMQEISSTLEIDSSNKAQVMLLDLTEDPAVTPTPAPVSEHQAPATSFSSENVVSPRDRSINTPAEAFLQEVEMRSPECNVEDLCRMMDDLHLPREPWVTPAPEPQRHHVVSNSLTPPKPMPILQPAPFVFKSPPAFAAFPEKEPEKEEMKSSADSSIEDLCRMLDEVHLSAYHWITPTPAPVPQCHRLVSSSSTTSKPLLQPATSVFTPTTAFASPEKKKKKKRSIKPEDSSVKDLCRKLKRLHLSRKYRDKPKPPPVPQHHLESSFSQMNGVSPLNWPKLVLRPAPFLYQSQPEFGFAQKEEMSSSSSVDSSSDCWMDCTCTDVQTNTSSNQHQLFYLP